MFCPQLRALFVVSMLAAAACCGRAQTATVGWLRYAIPPDPPRYHDMPHAVMLLGNGAGQAAPEEEAAAEELDRGLGHMVAGTDLLLRRFDPRIDAIVLGTTLALHHAKLGRSLPGWVEKPLPEEGFRIVHLRRGARQWYVLQGGSARAELWAAFRFSALVAEDQQLPEELIETPQLALRAIALDGDPAGLPPAGGSRERPGLFRLLAAVGINALIVDGTLSTATGLAAAMKPFGMHLWVKAHPGEVLQPGDVSRLPANLAGLVVGVPPHATEEQIREAMHQANALAKALQHSGRAVLVQGALGPALESNGDAEPLSPRQRAAMLRDHVEGNVVLTGEAVSSLVPLAGLASANFGLLTDLPRAAEFDLLPVRSEDLAYPLPAWQRSLLTPERAAHGDVLLQDALRTGSESAHGGVIAHLPSARVAEVLQQPLLQANLYAFGRFAWDPALDASKITEEWSRQTWGDDARVHAVVTRLLLGSAAAYTSNSSPFGLPSLADANGRPDPERAAQLHGSGGVPAADDRGIGTDRTAAGTDELAAYPEGFAAMLNDPALCPKEWLLAVHRLPYDARMDGDKTPGQAFYDAHFAGSAQPANAVDAWESTRPLVDEPRYRTVHAALEEAAHQAEIWRERTTEWLQHISGVRDALGFVGSHPGRVTADSLVLLGYTLRRTAASQPADGSLDVLVCRSAACSASLSFPGLPNVYRVEVGYARDGAADYQLRVNGVTRAQWTGGTAAAADESHAQNAERLIANGVSLKAGDTVEVYAMPHEGSLAPLQFIEITRDPRWN